ncbi:MAG: hypothetical protein DRR42_09340 [Gammaproteobacteria bacterium]|nr:MAG: hypothetical protein DRR42_09340 [Gammaproteobacteria bacterium]
MGDKARGEHSGIVDDIKIPIFRPDAVILYIQPSYPTWLPEKATTDMPTSCRLCSRLNKTSTAAKIHHIY